MKLRIARPGSERDGRENTARLVRRRLEGSHTFSSSSIKSPTPVGLFIELAEREGFEPSKGF
jgi:hypothetical protein